MAMVVMSKTMHDRWALTGAAAQVRGDAGNRRLHRQWVRFIARKKRGTIATVAGTPIRFLPTRGRAFAASLRARIGGPVDPYAVYGAAAAESEPEPQPAT